MANLARRSPFAFSGMSRYRDTGRRMVGGFGSYARRANTGIQSYGSSALARYNEARKSDTRGGLFADEMGTSPLGKRMTMRWATAELTRRSPPTVNVGTRGATVTIPPSDRTR